MLDVQKVRSEFPAIAHHPKMIYFDNASTTQKPQSVLDTVSEYHHAYCANPHRSTHDWGLRSTRAIEETRQKVADFLGLDTTQGLYFSSGATQSSFDLALHFCQHFLEDGDEVILSQDEHKTVLVAWEKATQITNKKIIFKDVLLDHEGDYNIADLQQSITANTKLIILSHIHNVFGIEMGIEAAREVIPAIIPIILDATQSVGHLPVKPLDLGVQAVYFSGHKMFGFSGTGVLWLGETFHTDTMTFERGTPNVEGILSLGAAIDYVSAIGLSDIESHLLDLTQYALQKLREIPGIEFLPGPAFCQCATGHGILSFRIDGSASQEVADWLNTHEIYVRSGAHCSHSKKAENSVRLSLHIYNTREELDRLINVLQTA